MHRARAFVFTRRMPQTKPSPASPPFAPASDADRLFALARDLLCVVGTNGYLERVNPAFEQVLGWTTAELLARPLLDFLHPDDRESTRAGLAECAAGRPTDGRHRVLCRDGSHRWLSWHGSAPDEHGRIYGVARDVTESRRVADALRDSEERHRSLFEHHPDAVFSFDLDGRFVSVNPACERISGRPPHELIGRSFADILLPEHLHVGLEHFRAASAGTAQHYELAIQHRDGGRVELGVVNVPIFVGDRVAGVFGIARDLTLQRTLEAQLRQAQKMEAVGRLAGGVAHDFNNLLTVIQNYGTLIADEVAEGSEIRADLDEILRASARAAELTRQLLAFGRKQVLQPRLLDANEQVSSVAGMLRRVIGEDIALETELFPGVWSAFADPGQLEQVLMNLAVNARDAMPDGGTLRLRTANATVCGPTLARPGLVAGDYVSIVVEDTGHGIDAATLPHIFEPFFTTKPPGEGTGLGLATVYGIVKQSDGYIYVDSAPGRGSRFTIFLPRAAASAAAPSGAAASPALPRGSETILLVEDEAAVRAVARRMLEALGYTVREAASGAEALRLAAEDGGGVDLVLTDVVMPEQNGRALVEQLLARWPALRALFMSGYTDDEILRRGLTEPGSLFLEKPFTAARLSSAVRRALDERDGAPRGRSSGGARRIE